MNYLIIGLLCLSFFTSIMTETETRTIYKILDEFKSKSKKDYFKVWHLLFNKKYDLSTEEAKSRFKIFKSNLKYFEEFNSQPNQKNNIGVGPFTDMTTSEFLSKYTLRNEATLNQFKYIFSHSGSKKLLEDDDDDLTKRILDSSNCTATQSDFRNMLLPPGNMLCGGDCYTFATNVVIEANYYQNKQKKVKLSVQYLDDCDRTGMDQGCGGGSAYFALPFAKGGVPKESDYRYTGQPAACPSTSGWEMYVYTGTMGTCPGPTSYDPCPLTTFLTLASTNVLVVTADLEGGAWQHYNRGIWWPAQNQQPYHSCAVVGVGCDQNGVLYIIVRNQWGPSWGEQGNMKYAITTPLPTPGLTSVAFYIQ